MDIIRVIYQGFDKRSGEYAQCIILIRRELYSLLTINEIATAEYYPVCSTIFTDLLNEGECKKEGGDIWDAYQQAVAESYAMSCFIFKRSPGNYKPPIPRFSEADFQKIFESIGGHKIAESKTETPDFRFGDTIMELKDHQKESLKGIDRQNNISQLFKNSKERCIDLNPLEDYGDATVGYRRLIKNSIHNHLKNASSQIKAYKLTEKVKSAGMIFLNTGMFSLPHELFKTMVSDLLEQRTKTIKFAFIFSQVTQGNGFDNYAIFTKEFIGQVPEEILPLNQAVSDLIEQKMTDMMTGGDTGLTLSEQEPISFFRDNKIFFWNPGPVPSTLCHDDLAV